MRNPRRRRGFEKAGSVPAGRLGFPSRRALELTLLQGWERVAGRDLSRNVRAVRVERGVLRIEAADRSWYDAVEPLLPRLAARLAAEQPRLRIKKYRLGLAGVSDERGKSPATETHVVPEFVAEDADGEAPNGGGRNRRRKAPPPAPAEATTADLQQRLELAAGRYADRKRSQKA